jgi:hypothetical protein
MMLASVYQDCLQLLIFGGIPAMCLGTYVRRSRREQILVRQWADSHGYAISEMRRTNVNLFATFLFWIVGWFFLLACKYAWQLSVYDSEGGEKDVWVRVRRDGQVEQFWN